MFRVLKVPWGGHGTVNISGILHVNQKATLGNMLSFSILLASLACLANASKLQGTLHRRNYFYAGGTFVQIGNLTYVHGQMYVEHLQPAKVTKPYPLLFIEGAGMTGSYL